MPLIRLSVLPRHFIFDLLVSYMPSCDFRAAPFRCTWCSTMAMASARFRAGTILCPPVSNGIPRIRLDLRSGTVDRDQAEKTLRIIRDVIQSTHEDLVAHNWGLIWIVHSVTN